MTSMTMRRRHLLATAAGGAAITVLPRAAGAQMQPATAEAIRKATGGKEPQDGRVALRLPPIAENGNTVPLTVSVDSPMTAADHVKTVWIFADKNPTPDVAVFHLTPALGRAQADTRMRLGQTQDVIAVAQMSDGAFYMARTEVKVTIGGCGG